MDLLVAKKNRPKLTLLCECGAEVKRNNITRGKPKCDVCRRWEVQQRALERKKKLRNEL